MNYVLIFKNNDALKEKGIIVSGVQNPSVIEPGTEVYLFNDTKSIADVKTEFQEKRLDNANNFYVILHKGKQGDSENDFIAFFGPHVKCQSHLPGEFYFEKLPKLIEGSLTFEDIKALFPDLSFETKLNLLHKCLTPEGTKMVSLNSLQNELKHSFNDFESAVTDFTDPFEKGYLDALAILRKDLLMSE